MLVNDTFQEIWHAAVSLSVASLFLFTWFFGDERYFTTWALFIYASYFAASTIVSLLEYYKVDAVCRFVWDGHFARWVFAPCLVISTSVSITVLYMLYDAWQDVYDVHCENQSSKCRDLIIEFVLTHYFPPVILFLSSVTDEKLITHPTTKKRDRNVHETIGHIIVLFQMSLIPNFIYGSFYDPKNVYGTSELSTYLIYGCSTLLMSTVWGLSRGH